MRLRMRPVKHKARHEKQNIVSKIKKLQHKIDDVNYENDRYADAYILFSITATKLLKQ